MATSLEKKLARVRRRCRVNVLLEQFGKALIVAGATAVVAIGVQRALSLPLADEWIAAGLGVGVVALTALLFWRRRPSLMGVALLADERLRCHERFSTALALAQSEDPFAQAAVQEAHQTAEQLDVQGRFPVRPSRRWVTTACVWVVAAGLFLFLPGMDLLGHIKREQEQQQREKELQQAKADIQQVVGQVETAIKELDDPELAAALQGIAEANLQGRPEEARRETIRKLGDLSEKLKELQQSDAFKKAEAVKTMLQQLKETPDGLSRDLSRAMAKSDFAKASKMIKQLQKDLEEGQLTDEQKKAMQKQMKDLAEQLETLAAKKKQLQDALKEAGVDSDLARLTKEELEKKLKEAGLNQEQIDKLLNECQQCQNAGKQMKDLAEALREAGDGQPAQMDELAGKMDQLEAMIADMKAAQAGQEGIDAAIAALGEGDCAGDGLWEEGFRQRRQDGTGGPGQGFGADPIADSGQSTAQDTRVDNQPDQGQIIARWYFKGTQVKGESKRQFSDAVQAGRDRAAEAISDQRILRKYEAAVKKYYGQMEELGNQ